MPIRFGFVGLDHWYNGIPTLEALVRHPEAEVVALAHRDAVRAREVGERLGVTVVPGYDDVIGRDDVDVVCCFASADENAAVCVRAIEAGKAVMAIKPMAMSLAEADRVVAVVRERGALYFPNDAVRRFNPANQQIRAWLDEGRIGEPLFGHCLFRAGLPREWPDAAGPGWFADPARVPGGAFIDHAVYHVDLLRWLLRSEVAAVTGMTANVRHQEIALEDYGHAVLRLANGTMGTIEDTWTSVPGAPRETFEVVGSRGSMINDTATGRLALTGDFGLGGWVQAAPPAARSTYVDHVIGCVRGNEAPASSAEDARANLAACLAFYEAARTGRTVEPAPAGTTA